MQLKYHKFFTECTNDFISITGQYLAMIYGQQFEAYFLANLVHISTTSL